MKRLILMMTMCAMWTACMVEGDHDEPEKAEMALTDGEQAVPVETERCHGDHPDGCAPPPTVQVAEPLCERVLDCGPPP